MVEELAIVGIEEVSRLLPSNICGVLPETIAYRVPSRTLVKGYIF